MTFDANSRYTGASLRTVTGPDGKPVTVVDPPTTVAEPTLGWHLYRQGQRLDHIAHRFLGHATQWWRLPDHNNAMWPDALAGAPEIAVPPKKRPD
ncbi:MAG: hypothetical protein DHS20C19_22420 [Acidimicrobiales bacterium]|nr:MAG: hypothetical protein DHS20C19_22420 [Acidimicrobiales bacterium]